ncbi:penicillin-binding transpeptidase domain-containing protein [Aminicella lysinilytica]|uniref:Peptidoglycan glycosyltransferase n=1 Tax=Aminicella lysinilytica TaxID=433323 RepID=A0A4R6Q7D0_9FIRM|nr:penicillin-binding transpeptidase domain-containing protein [Aminicella lysinilytica]TDP57927.1 peptidoglycan glycosyltransferase [Aminicella lysinilytica]
MKKLEKRAVLCLLLAAVLFAGLCVFVVKFVLVGDDWATYYANSHIYDSGRLSIGKIYDVNGNILAKNGGGIVKYSSDKETRMATVHAVGDMDGNISTSAESAFKDKLVGYNTLTGVYSITGKGNDITLTIDKDICKTAYEALGSYNGCVGVYNYKTGEIICMVSKPTLDPADPPSTVESGTYINKFLSGTITPGSIFKLLTSAAAIENLDDLSSWTYTCSGTRYINGEKITCTQAHGTVNFRSALAKSCNCGFSELTQEIGASTMKSYVKKCGLTTSYDIDGVHNAKGSFEFPSNATLNLAWAGIGQWKDQLNPCSMLVYLSAIANDGKGTVPKLIHSSLGTSEKTNQMIDSATATKLRSMMRNNVTSEYGQYNYPGLKIYAKSGTAEVYNKNPNAWFAGFIKNSNYPYAFIVCVEDSGYGSAVAGPVANKVLQKLVSTSTAASN